MPMGMCRGGYEIHALPSIQQHAAARLGAILRGAKAAKAKMGARNDSPRRRARSRPSDAHHLAAACINLDDHRLEQPAGLSWKSSTKRHPPDRLPLGGGQHRFHAIRLERHFLPRDLDGLLASDLGLNRPCGAGHRHKRQRSQADAVVAHGSHPDAKIWGRGAGRGCCPAWVGVTPAQRLTASPSAISRVQVTWV